MKGMNALIPPNKTKGVLLLLPILVVGLALAEGGGSSGLATGLNKAINELKAGGEVVKGGVCFFSNILLPVILYGAAAAAIALGLIMRATVPNARWYLWTGGGVIGALLFTILIPLLQSLMGGDRCRAALEILDTLRMIV